MLVFWLANVVAFWVCYGFYTDNRSANKIPVCVSWGTCHEYTIEENTKGGETLGIGLRMFAGIQADILAEENPQRLKKWLSGIWMDSRHPSRVGSGYAASLLMSSSSSVTWSSLVGSTSQLLMNAQITLSTVIDRFYITTHLTNTRLLLFVIKSWVDLYTCCNSGCIISPMGICTL